MQRLYLGVDGGGTRCRARLTDEAGKTLGEGIAGPANIRLGAKESLSSVLDAAGQCLAAAGLPRDHSGTVACLALAGACQPTDLDAIRKLAHPFQKVVFATDAHAACAGAHGGGNGGVIIVGTGSVGWGMVDGVCYRVGGWGFPVSDEGSGAWLGLELARRILWAHDGRTAWTGLLRAAFTRFQSDPHRIVRWMGTGRPCDFAVLAPLIVDHATRGDTAACDLMAAAASHVDALAARLAAHGVAPLSLSGGLARPLQLWLAEETRRSLVPPKNDALSGALLLARAGIEAASLAA